MSNVIEGPFRAPERVSHAPGSFLAGEFERWGKTGEVVQLWNPKAGHKLKRHWVNFGQSIVIEGQSLYQTGVLVVQRISHDMLQTRLDTMGRQFEENVTAGCDISIWIRGLELIVGVRAVRGERMLVDFGIPPGSKARIIIEDLPVLEDQPLKVP